MLDYIMADFKRIAMRIPRAIVLALVYAVLVIVIVVAYNNTWNSITFVTFITQYISFLTVIIGVIELIGVYSDDFKAKTMQIAIGSGTSRPKVVLCKLIETAIFVFLDLVIFAIVGLGLGTILGAGLEASQVGAILAQLVNVWLSVVAYTSIAMILMFFSQGTGIATLLFILLCTGIVSNILELLLTMDAILFLHLNKFLLSYMLNVFQSHLILGSFSFLSALGILVYIAVGYGLTVALFQKRELEF